MNTEPTTTKAFACPRPPPEPTDPIALAAHQEKLRILTLVSVVDFYVTDAANEHTLPAIRNAVAADLHRKPFIVSLANIVQSAHLRPESDLDPDGAIHAALDAAADGLCAWIDEARKAEAERQEAQP